MVGIRGKLRLGLASLSDEVCVTIQMAVGLMIFQY